jgi:hypothetical protein
MRSVHTKSTRRLSAFLHARRQSYKALAASALYRLFFSSPSTPPPLLHTADYSTSWLSAPSLRTRTSTCCAGRAGSSLAWRRLLTVAQSRCLRDTYQRIRNCCRRCIRELLQVRAAQKSAKKRRKKSQTCGILTVARQCLRGRAAGCDSHLPRHNCRDADYRATDGR